jgi:hypothetical protein
LVFFAQQGGFSVHGDILAFQELGVKRFAFLAKYAMLPLIIVGVKPDWCFA